MRDRPQALSRAAARLRLGFGRLLRGSPPRYAVAISHAGQTRSLDMDTRAAARLAQRFKRRADGSIAFAFAPGAHAYLVQRGNPARFSEPHRVAAFPSGKGEEARLHVRAEGGAFAEGCRLYVQYHDGRQRLSSFSLTLRGPSQTMTFRAPPGGATASIALRLAGAGVLPPLALSVKLTAGAKAGAEKPEIAAFDRLALLAAGAASRIVGVYETQDGRLAGRRFEIRPDQGVPVSAALPISGLVFDDTIAPPFGWQGTFDENTYANMALVRILGEMERAGLPSILVFDARTETKPLFPELSALFTHQVRKNVETDSRLAQILRLG